MTFTPVEYRPELHPSPYREWIESGMIWESENHIVIKRDVDLRGRPACWLSIKRKDNGRVGWTEKQQIKNAMVSDESEGFEVYPSESRKIDTSNQYHLWVFKDNTTLGVPFYTQNETRKD